MEYNTLKIAGCPFNPIMLLTFAEPDYSSLWFIHTKYVNSSTLTQTKE